MIRRSVQELRGKQVLWAGNICFGGYKSTSRGAIVIDGQTIASCYPGVTEKEASTLSKNFTSFHSFGEQAVILPGLIDVHCHISELGRDWEGYYHATRAGTAGGLTTLMGMPLNSIPATVCAKAFSQEVQKAESTPLAADVGLWGGVLPDSNIDEILKCGIFGIKAFLAPLPKDAGYQSISPDRLSEVAEKCGLLGLPVLVHSELMTAEEVEAASDRAYAVLPPEEAHVQSRPRRWERGAVSVVCNLAKQCHMHVVHLSDAEETLELIRKAKALSHNKLTVETCPHYLTNFDDSMKKSRLIKCFPPIRSDANRKKLIEAISNGDIDMLASDHSPCSPDMRLDPSYREAWGGISGLQYQLHSTLASLDDVATNDKFQTIARLWGSSPASLVPGMATRKGAIRPGLRADLCVLDPTSNNHRKVMERHRWKDCSPYTAMDLKGSVLATFLNGQRVYDGESDKIADDESLPGSLLIRPTRQ